jgi:hypothetical protein
LQAVSSCSKGNLLLAANVCNNVERVRYIHTLQNLSRKICGLQQQRFPGLQQSASVCVVRLRDHVMGNYPPRAAIFLLFKPDLCASSVE